ncbi:copper transporter [Nocardia pseudobrasiliensis]|uniref:Copper transport outer membrane protein MctB n=1 Tax=Nocardia pseudobrasiliensis TaxID=45979 RepID=A0A370HMD8_9NOCA|nr:copper transporter [Nocardia pseudobrasiliensis]RDI59659.1 copper transport outer membrane protein MctB [Nocardia pseudobrasiliensis]
MIWLRRRAVPIASVILALSCGLLLGSHVLDRDAHAMPWSKGGDRQRAETLSHQNGRLADELNAANGFIARSAGKILTGALNGRSVLIFTTPDADSGDVDAVGKALTTAGAAVTGKIALTDAFIDSGQGDRLRTVAANMIPAGAQLQTGAVDQGSLVGDLLGLAFLVDPGNGQQRATPQERTLILDTLRGGGFVNCGEVQPAQLAVVVTGSGAKADLNNRGSIIGRFAGGLRGRGAGVVLAGRAGAADGAGPIAVVRADSRLADTVTTVDNIDREIGRITTALGLSEQLGGGAGRYGTGPKANSLTVVALPR